MPLADNAVHVPLRSLNLDIHPATCIPKSMISYLSSLVERGITVNILNNLKDILQSSIDYYRCRKDYLRQDWTDNFDSSLFYWFLICCLHADSNHSRCTWSNKFSMVMVDYSRWRHWMAKNIFESIMWRPSGSISYRHSMKKYDRDSHWFRLMQCICPWLPSLLWFRDFLPASVNFNERPKRKTSWFQVKTFWAGVWVNHFLSQIIDDF